MLGFPSRHLGSIQMTTDTALGVTKLVVQDGIALDKIPYVVRMTTVQSCWFLTSVPGHADDPVQCQGICRDALQ